MRKLFLFVIALIISVIISIQMFAQDASNAINEIVIEDIDFSKLSTLFGFLSVFVGLLKIWSKQWKFSLTIKDILIVVIGVGLGYLYEFVLAPVFGWKLEGGWIQVGFLSFVYSLSVLGITKIFTTNSKVVDE